MNCVSVAVLLLVVLALNLGAHADRNNFGAHANRNVTYHKRPHPRKKTPETTTSSGTSIQNTTKFLNPEYVFGPNNQFYEFAELAKRAAKTGETLVLAHFFATPRQGPDIEVPEDYFDIPRLERLLHLKTIRKSDFIEMCSWGNTSFFVRGQQVQPFISYRGKFSPGEVPVGMAALRFTPRMNDLASSVLSSLDWGDAVVDATLASASQTFENRHHMLAVHLRRQMSWISESCVKTVCNDPEDIARIIIETAKATNNTRVYLSMNDATAEEHAFFRKTLAASGLHLASSASSPVFQNLEPFTASIVEQQICYLARDFFGTYTSTWTGTVAMMRSSDEPPRPVLLLPNQIQQHRFCEGFKQAHR
jgi:hypothetical protein